MAYSHGHVRTVGQDKLLVVAQTLDGGEDVVPAAAVEARRVVLELVQELVHLERGEDGLDQARRADGAARQAQLVLRQVERVVPQARLQVRLHLGQVKVRSDADLQRLLRVVEKVQAKVKERAGHGHAVDEQVLLLQMPAAGAHDQRGDLAVELVLLGTLGERDGLPVGVAEVDVSLRHARK